MNSEETNKIESLESWGQSVAHDKEMIKYDVAMVAACAGATGIGLYNVAKGNIGDGILISGVGAAATYAFAKEAFQEIEMLAKSSKILGKRESSGQ